jgi:hypothetical protein
VGGGGGSVAGFGAGSPQWRERLPREEIGKAIPFGVWDMTTDEGFVVVDDDHDIDL